MRNPNGYGGISKLPGNRRRPWRVRVTTSRVGGKQTYKAVGYYATREEAMIALAEYNKHPYDLDLRITFAEVYEKWSAAKFETISESNIKGYKASYKVCEPLYNMVFAEIRLIHLQTVVDTCGKNYPTLRKLSNLFGQLYDFAMKHEICQKNYSEYVDIARHKDPAAEPKHTRFSAKEVSSLWENVGRNDYVSVVLMLIYTGVRISELLDLKKENVHLSERYFEVLASKTEAGIRVVPIAKKALPFFEQWMTSGGPYLIPGVKSSHMVYHTFFRNYWEPLMAELKFDHLPHDTRHTTISMLAEKNINPTIIKRIVGHAGAMSLTERVYTHFEVKELIDAIDAI